MGPGALGCLWAVTRRRDRWAGLALGILCALAASYSFGEGLIIWPVGVLALAAGWRRLRLPACAAWIAAAGLTLWSYALNDAKPPRTPETHFALDHPLCRPSSGPSSTWASSPPRPWTLPLTCRASGWTRRPVPVLELQP
jgi:4-amino-4-deoxy-L-arabinose transferase-like glycosyltransferase